ncbi:DNA polymerase IV [Hymenobacter sp. 5516J-16]|uniref:DNA polymerase IV n=1 Tax=Hymenobacter sp. 5516J-16 TaxID=2932253 RepID=UPI00293E90F2|nr:DNA polymerase IV [Hymenobacter sp. 5516J-16]
MDTSEARKIIHLDMDAFYASVEQRDNPVLRGKPVAVGGSRQRGVVAAASYEARQFGVRSAMPSSTALRKCPELVFVKPRFEVYKEVSRQIRAIFAEYTPLIEPLSLDEAYLDVTENLKGIALATQVAREIRAAILQKTQLTASAGISYNKFLAKLASDYRKPNGQFVIRPSQGLEFVAGLAVGQFHGIGPATAARLNHLGIFSGLDLRQQSETFLRQHFGKAGSHYYRIARAQDFRPVVPDRLRKSIGSETTFEQDLLTPEELTTGLQPCLASVWQHCQRTGLRGRTVTLKVKYADFQQITRSRTLFGVVPGPMPWLT